VDSACPEDLPEHRERHSERVRDRVDERGERHDIEDALGRPGVEEVARASWNAAKLKTRAGEGL